MAREATIPDPNMGKMLAGSHGKSALKQIASEYKSAKRKKKKSPLGKVIMTKRAS